MPPPVPTVTTVSGARWQDVAADRQRHRDSTLSGLDLPALGDLPLNVTGIPRQVLTAAEHAIVSLDVEVLAARLAARELTVVEVTEAFLRAAGLAQKLANCVTELLPETARARAAELDAHMAEHGKPVGPLHGVPISVKEHIGMVGLDLNAGFVSWVGRVAPADAHILKILRAAGAVFYARSTQPQTLMHLETSSALYGATVNPFNRNLTSGGSSGGEGALVGLRASVLGIGTDIGGSIRSPAANCGVFGFKPTSGRLPFDGLEYTMHGADSIVPTIGPLSTSLAGVRLFVKTLLDAKPWITEPLLVPLEWKDNAVVAAPFAKRRVKVAVMWNDGVCGVHPPVERALRKVVAAVQTSKRVELVEWKPYKHDEAWRIISNLYFTDGGDEETLAIESSGEPWMPLSRFIVTENPQLQHHTMASLMDAHNARDAYRDKYNALWISTADGATLPSSEPDEDAMVDCILCAAGPSAAPRLDTARYWGYTAQWNLLDYPAVVFPVAEKVDPALDGDAPYTPMSSGSAADAYNANLWKEHGAEGYKDAPICLQLVGRRFADEKLLAALEILMQEARLPLAVTSL